MNALVTIPTNNVEIYRASTDAASLCREIVLKTAMEFQGRKYVKVEGWQAIAVAHGCTASARDVERMEGGVRAIGEIRRMSDGKVIAEAEGFVGEDEPTWFGGMMKRWKWGQKRGEKIWYEDEMPKRPDYAIRAMAQTRAISRACRSAFAHVVVLIDENLSTTPAEEMGWDHSNDAEPVNVTPARDEAAKPEGPSPIFTACKAAIDLCEDEDALNDWKAKNAKAFEQMSDDDYNAVGAYWKGRVKAVRAAAKTTQQPQGAPADEFGLSGDDIPNFA